MSWIIPLYEDTYCCGPSLEQRHSNWGECWLGVGAANDIGSKRPREQKTQRSKDLGVQRLGGRRPKGPKTSGQKTRRKKTCGQKLGGKRHRTRMNKHKSHNQQCPLTGSARTTTSPRMLTATGSGTMERRSIPPRSDGELDPTNYAGQTPYWPKKGRRGWRILQAW